MLLPFSAAGDAMTPFFLSQILAGLSFGLDVLAFQFVRRQRSLQTLACSTSLLALHFWLLGEVSACGLMALAACRYLLATVTTSQRVKGGFLCASVLCSVLTWQHATDIFPLAGSLLMTVAAFQSTATGLRLITVSGSLCWLINNILAGSPMAIVMEGTFMLSTLVSYWRLKRGAAVAG